MDVYTGWTSDENDEVTLNDQCVFHVCVSVMKKRRRDDKLQIRTPALVLSAEKKRHKKRNKILAHQQILIKISRQQKQERK